LFKTKASFRKELKRQIRYAIAAAVGFLIAFAWRNSIINIAQDIVARFTESTKVVASNLSSAMLITLIGVLIIFLSSKILKDK
jgi:biotin transporter BioY